MYRRLGLALLRTAWFNLDWLWAGALVTAGMVVEQVFTSRVIAEPVRQHCARVGVSAHALRYSARSIAAGSTRAALSAGM